MFCLCNGVPPRRRCCCAGTSSSAAPVTPSLTVVVTVTSPVSGDMSPKSTDSLFATSVAQASHKERCQAWAIRSERLTPFYCRGVAHSRTQRPAGSCQAACRWLNGVLLRGQAGSFKLISVRTGYLISGQYGGLMRGRRSFDKLSNRRFEWSNRSITSSQTAYLISRQTESLPLVKSEL